MRRRLLVPWVVLAGSLLLTALATWGVADSTRERDEERFLNAVQATQGRIEARLEMYVALLRGGAGLFAATDVPVTRTDFREYTERLGVQQRYPGVQGIGFSLRVTPSQEDSLTEAMQSEGFSSFRIWPDTAGLERHAIVYLEPLDERNLAAIGFNMFSEATRRDAMTRARDTGLASVSGAVTLVQEISGRRQAGFLIYVPVYRQGGIPSSITERRATLEGFVYAPFRADDLFEGLLRTEERPRAAFRIYDGAQADPGSLLHDSRSGGVAPADSPQFTALSTLGIGGRMWTIRFEATPVFSEGPRGSLAGFILAAGLLLSLVLFALSRAQVQAGENVRETERRLRAVLESLPVGVFVADPAGHITFANDASRDIWGGRVPATVEQYDGFRGWRADTGQRLEPQDWALARALRGEKVDRETVNIETAEGEHKTVLTSAFPLNAASGQVQMAVSAVVDITEQKRAEAALRQREQELRTLVDAFPQLAWMADEGGNISWYNQRWFEYTGTTLEEMKGLGWQKVQHPEHVERVTAHVRHAFSTGDFWEDTFPIRSKSGEYRWFLSRAVPLRDEEGRTKHWFGTNTDITEQLQAREAEARAIREQAARAAAEAREEEVRRYAAELERSNRELQDFAYVASHDLQEPLRKISTLADFLNMEYAGQLDAQGIHYLSRIQDAAVRMASLIRDLLAFSRVATQAQPFEAVDLNAALSDVVMSLEVRLQETGGRVEATGLPTVKGDPLQIQQLFQNLIANALKFHRAGVPPVVRVSGAEEAAAGKRKVWRIDVADNGIGFDEKYLDRIFTPFQRLHSKTEYEGTGIGLAICRRIVERHGGSITARSTPGEGSVFSVTLPAA